MIDILSYRQWAISQQFADSFGLVALKLLSEGKSIEHLIKKHNADEIRARYAMLPYSSDGLVISTEWDRESQLEIATTSTGQNVAIIPVLGALTKRGDLCSYGMRDYVGMIERANKTQKIAAIVLDMESPGGTVDGTNELGLAVKQSKKPVVAFGDGIVASAAYWVASQAREIIANKNNATEFGSIGVLYIHENYQAYIQKEIGSVEIIRAPQSVDKARVNVIEPLTEDQRLDIKSELKTIAQDFISTVKKGRAGKLNTADENIFTGKMYPASVAKDMGMIDALDTLQGAINRAGQLATSSSTFGSSRTQVNTQMKFPKLSALLGQSGKAKGDETNDPKESQSAETASMEAAEKKLADMEADNGQMKAENAAQKTKITELETTVAEQKAQITTLTESETKLKAANETLQKQVDAKPNGQATTIIPDGNKESKVSTDPKAATEQNQYRTSIDADAAALREQQAKLNTFK